MRNALLAALLALVILVSGCLGATSQTSTASSGSLTTGTPTESQDFSIIYPENPIIENLSVDESGPLLENIYSPTAVQWGNLTIEYDGSRIRGRYDFLLSNLSENAISLALTGVPDDPDVLRLNLTIEGVPVDLSRLSGGRIFFEEALGRPITRSYLTVYEIRFNSSRKNLRGEITYSLRYPVFLDIPEQYAGSPLTWWEMGAEPVGLNMTYSLPEGYTLVVPGFGAFNGSGTLNGEKLLPLLFGSFINDGPVVVKNVPAAGINVTVYIPRKQYNPLHWADLERIVKLSVETYVNTTGLRPFSDIHLVVNPDFTGSFMIDGTNSAVIGERRGIELIVRKRTGSIPHELAHIWFAGYADFKYFNEGFATYMQSLALKRIVPARFNAYLELNEKSIVEYGRSISIHDAMSENLLDLRKLNVSTVLYTKGAFTLRSLQFVLGDETFYRGLHEALVRCHGAECGLADVEGIFEDVSGEDLDWFFGEWFNSTLLPDYTVENLTVTNEGDGYRLRFRLVDRSNFTMPVQVRVVTEDAKFVDTTVVVENGLGSVNMTLEAKPTMIVIDPGEWMANINRKFEVEGIKVEVD
ncbi:putative aminopeptidase [Thermococcus sp. 4557]|uniref:M1 family aminopeptidase n=1 Tax=Thermococcus sp. (strain CGMCC 1.5172 / 4557) TaxID=1042877 RepID=UPI000219EA4C|nr:M1 family aminopeptidase [Thermococcus sp. 4557]AEK73303.1 putative aminopeptidase [Thermococcus sp. 4557]